MAPLTLAFDAAFAAATALVYGYVGELTRRRTAPDPEGKRALVMFSVWWYGLAAITLAGAARSALAALGILDLGLFVALTYVTLPVLAAVLWGLVYYLLYIYTGRASLFWPVTLFHVVMLVALTYLTVWLGPKAVTVTDWSVSLEYTRTASGPIVGVLIFGILGPALFAALGYGTLLFRAKDATTRYRVAMVAGGFILWFGSAALAAVLGVGSQTSPNYVSWWPLVSRVIALVSTFLVLLAYQPPRFLRERYGIQAVTTTRASPTNGPRRLLPVATTLRTRA